MNVVWCCIQQKDDAVKMALKRELQLMSAESRLKRVCHNSDDDDDNELPLLYPFDADQVPYTYITCF